MPRIHLLRTGTLCNTATLLGAVGWDGWAWVFMPLATLQYMIPNCTFRCTGCYAVSCVSLGSKWHEQKCDAVAALLAVALRDARSSHKKNWSLLAPIVSLS